MELLLLPIFEPLIGGFLPYHYALVVGLFVVAVLGTLLGAWFSLDIWRNRRKAVSAVRQVLKRVPLSKPPEATGRPPYLLADSVDREILIALHESGGDIIGAARRLEDRALIPTDEEFDEKLAKLHVLGLVYLSEKAKKMYLTGGGLDVLRMPAALFVSHIPDRVFEHVFQEKMKLWAGEWDGVVVETGRALESALCEQLELGTQSNPAEWQRIVSESKPESGFKGPISGMPAGRLLDALRNLGRVKPNSFEDFLVGQLVALRNLIHARKETTHFGPAEAGNADMFLEILLRLWYGPKK